MVEQFVTNLKLPVGDFSLKEPDEPIRDKISFGTNSHKIREKLINEEKELTLDNAVYILRTYEMSQSQIKSKQAGDEAYTVPIEIGDPETILQGHQRSCHSEVHVVDAERPTHRIHVHS